MIPLEDWFNGKTKTKFKHGDEFQVDHVVVILLEISERRFTTVIRGSWIMGGQHHILDSEVSLEELKQMLPSHLQEYEPVPIEQTINSLYKGSILTNIQTDDTYMLTKDHSHFVLTNLSTGVAIDSTWYDESVPDQCCLSKDEWLDWHPLDRSIDTWLIADGPVQIG